VSYIFVTGTNIHTVHQPTTEQLQSADRQRIPQTEKSTADISTGWITATSAVTQLQVHFRVYQMLWPVTTL